MPVNYGYLSDLTTYLTGNVVIGADPGNPGSSLHSIGPQTGNQFKGGVLSVVSGIQFPFGGSNTSLNLNQSRLMSFRTLAASAVTASAGITNVADNEMVMVIGGASGATLIINSGGTLYHFSSAASSIRL